MFKKITVALAGFAIAGAALLGARGATTALAYEPPPAWPEGCPSGPGDHGVYDHPWLALSIVESAAKVIGIPARGVVEGLRDDHTLEQIAAVHGVDSFHLRLGILRDEREDLHRQVLAGHITRHEAYHIYGWLTFRIDEIVSRHFPCLVMAEPPV